MVKLCVKSHDKMAEIYGKRGRQAGSSRFGSSGSSQLTITSQRYKVHWDEAEGASSKDPTDPSSNSPRDPAAAQQGSAGEGNVEMVL